MYSAQHEIQHFPDMNRPDMNCPELTEKTAAVLDDESLQLLFVSTQRNNLKLCTTYAVKRSVDLVGCDESFEFNV